MRQVQRPSFDLGPPAGPVTKGLCWGLGLASLIFSVTQRKLGFGIEDLIFRVDAVLDLELWRLLTYPFVQGTPYGLIISVVVLYLFGRFFEARWGSRDYARFFFVSTVGAAILAIPLGFITNLIMPFSDVGVASGPGAAFDAMLIALAVTAPDSNVMFGFLLPIKTKTLVYLILGFDLIVGIQTGATALGITLGGMVMGYLLVTGTWRPQRLAAKIKLWTTKRRHRGLYVVPPRDDRTLHRGLLDEIAEWLYYRGHMA